MPNELKPCPFCGGEATVELAHPHFVYKKYHDRYVIVGCRSCGITTHLYAANNKTRSPLLNKANTEKAQQKAIEAWNRRADNG